MPGAYLAPARIWLVIALAALLGVPISMVIADWVGAQPCHLCITQRALLLSIVPFALAAWRAWPGVGGVIAGIGAIGAAVTGGVVAARQSFLERQPPDVAAGCTGLFEPTPSERVAAWLGDAVPWLFTATGNCGAIDEIALGVSFANASFATFAAVAAAGGVIILRRVRA